MTYLRRAIKYFIQTCLLLAIIIGILMLSGMVSKDISVAFTHGWKSIWWILAIFAVMALVYPFFGYQKRKIRVIGDPAQAVLKFHLSAPVNRAFRFWEDTITLTPVLEGWEAEGLSRDLVRVVSSIEHYFRNREKD